MINIIISDEAKIPHFVGQMYKSDYFTDKQMTKYEIVSDANKVWDKSLAHFMDLFSLYKAYGDDKAANSKVESVITHPPAAVPPPPTPRVTSLATSTSRAWSNHVWHLGTTALRM